MTTTSKSKWTGTPSNTQSVKTVLPVDVAPTATPQWLVYFQNQIVGEVVEFPALPEGSLYSVLANTPENRAAIASWVRPVSARKQAASEVAAILDGLREDGESTLELRGTIANAWANINVLLDLNKQAAMDAFDALLPTLPSEIQDKAPGLRSLLAAI